MMPLPLFFHLAIISWRKLDLVKLPALLCPPCAGFPPIPHLVSEAASVSPSPCVFSLPLIQLLRHAGVVFAWWVDRKRQWPGDAFGSVRDFVSSCWGYKLRVHRSSYPTVKWTPWESNASGICFVCLADIKEMTASWILKPCERRWAPLNKQQTVIFCSLFFKGKLALQQLPNGCSEIKCWNAVCVQKK